MSDAANGHPSTGATLTASTDIKASNSYWEVQLDIEPLSGVLMNANKRFQSNFIVPSQWIFPTASVMNSALGGTVFSVDPPPSVMNAQLASSASANGTLMFPYMIIDERM